MSALERIDTGGVTIPPALKGSGVRVVERDGVRSVVFTDEVFLKFNVVSPTTELAALDPLWKPSLAVIQLNPATHGYDGEKKGEVALAKNGILALADGAGIQIRTRRMKRDELRDSEIGWTATALIRQSGGTFKELEQSKVIDIDHERELINDQTIGAEKRYAEKDNRAPDMAKATEKARQRWLKERPHMDAKCETKAMLRAIRAAMQLRHALPIEQFSKPWIVVKIGFSPDYDDPTVRRAALEAGLNATTSLYGDQGAPRQLEAPTVVDDETGEVLDGELVDEPASAAAEPPAATPAAAAEEDPDEAYAEYQRQQAAEAAAPVAAAGQTNSWQAIMDAAGATTVTFGKHNGLSLGNVYSVDANYLDWLVSAQYQPKNEAAERLKAHARDVLQAAAALGLPRGVMEKTS